MLLTIPIREIENLDHHKHLTLGSNQMVNVLS